MSNKDEHYVDNKKLLRHLKEFRERRKKDPNAPVDDYIGWSILKIAERYTSRPNFAGYTYRQDMINTAVLNVLQYIGNFDPDKSNNPFAYITQIIHFACLRVIREEKTQQYVKYKSLQKFYDENDIDVQESDTDNNFDMSNPLYDNMEDFINEFEESVERMKQNRSANASPRTMKNKTEKKPKNQLVFEDDEDN